MKDARRKVQEVLSSKRSVPLGNAEMGSEVASAYDQWSEAYETVENATRDLAAQVLRRRFPDLQGRDVLEIGCGTGVNTRYLAEQALSVQALDFSSGMLAQARANVPANNVRFAQQDIRLPWNLPDGAVDLIVCTLVLEHIEDLIPIFAQARRVLRPGGEFFLCELHPFRQMQGRQAQFLDAETGELVLVSAYLHDISDYLNTAIEHGFSLLHLGEWRDGEEAAQEIVPRVLSVHLSAPPHP